MSETVQNGEKLTSTDDHDTRDYDTYTCPDWCDGHDQDSIVRLEAEADLLHMAGVGGGWLHEMRNPVSDRLVRDGLANWEVGLSKLQDGTPYNVPAFVDLLVGNRSDGKFEVTLDLTPGEARSLAAVLTAAADRAEVIPARRRFPRYVRGDLR